jgi:hypothetical protein
VNGPVGAGSTIAADSSQEASVSHAVVLHVDLPPASEEEGMRMLNEFVIPAATSQQGFQKGLWIDLEDYKGMAVVVFDTEANAEAAKAAVAPPPDGPTVISIGVHRVVAEA